MRNKMIPYLAFHGMHGSISGELKAAASKVIDSSWYVLGKEVKSFEEQFCNYVDVQYGIGVNSGLDALIIALRCLGVGEGDEVIVASNAYIACWNAIFNVGAKIILVEPDPRTFNIDPKKIEDAVTSKTKAIMAVHLFGQMCEMDQIMSIAAEYSLFVVEDNAQAQGAQRNGRFSASIGHINATSFYPGKNLGALGDAGIITTNGEEWSKKAFALRNYGCHEKYLNDYIGMNSRLDEMQAALLSVKLEYLTKWNDQRQKIARIYAEGLQNISELQLPIVPEDGSHVCHIYCIRTVFRDALQAFLLEQRVQTLIHYPIPPHLQTAYKFLNYKKGDFPIAEALAVQSISLPMYPGLTEKEIAYIVSCIRAFFAKKVGVRLLPT